jgi:hydroxyethylthiazole kinase-like uncharacterized protein yjeF
MSHKHSIARLFDYKKNLQIYLPPRKEEAHKGDFGHVFIIGGDEGFSGAVRLAGEAAYRVGAGRVTILTHSSHAAFLNVTCPELMCRSLSRPSELKKYLTKADTIIFGPGLGQSAWSQKIFHAFFAKPTSIPTLVDADGLNLLAKFPMQTKNWILTPHVGEAARLLNQTMESVQKNRAATAKNIRQQYSGIVVLKGKNTLIQGETLVNCPFGNPGMATAGMGDVLSGVIGGLLAQKVPLEIAASLGVYIHALAGDLAAKNFQRGLMASDLMPLLRQLVN